MLLSRVRVEEKLLIEAMDRLGVAYRTIDDRELVFDLDDPHASPFAGVDVVLERCLSFSRASYALRVLNGWGVPTVNTAAVMDLCGDKLLSGRTVAAHAAGLHPGVGAARHRINRLSLRAQADRRLVGTAAGARQRPGRRGGDPGA
jgi:glutathione synthase/RimK-type ligase-like ATP-grasp enzyme